MQKDQVNTQCYQEDEIDLRELLKTIIKHKKFIVVFTSIVTILAIIYSLVKTPIYEVKSNLQIGFIGKNLIANPNTLVKTANLIFNVGEKLQTKKPFVSKVSSIAISKKLKNFVAITTQAISNKEALVKNKEVVSYIQNRYKNIIKQYIINTDNNIRVVKANISKLENLTKKNIQGQIKLLTTQKIVQIDEKIRFYKIMKLKILDKKIKFYSDKLAEYEKSIQQIYQNNKQNRDTTTLTIASIQMVNYQNLILNAQNKIEDLKLEIDKIKNEIIPTLQREKENIRNNTLRKLVYKLNVELPNDKLKLKEQIIQLKFDISPQNIQNSKVIGRYIVHDYPVKPKKKLIVIVAFVTGLILSIFLVFFLEFIKNMKEEDS